MDKEKKVFIVILVVVSVLIAGFLYSRSADAAGFREQRAWQFDSPIHKAAKVSRESLRLLARGGYYKGSHANKSVYVEAVYVDDVSGSLHYQTTSTVGNQTVIQQNGDGTLSYDGTQASGSQGSTNTSQGNVVGAQGATDVTQSGSQSQGDWILNGSGS